MKIILIGFMGSGKSSVAKRLSIALKMPILEMDERVLQKTDSRNMHEVFAKGGEMLLRETELSIARESSSMSNIIISTGAGVVQNKMVVDYLKQPKGNIFFLNAGFQTICSRLSEDRSRPLFTHPAEANALYNLRYPLYLNYADKMIDVDQKSVNEITEEIIKGCYGK